jgi:hypothetical protein
MEECRGHVGPNAHNLTGSIKSIEKNQMTHDAVWLEPPRNLSPLLGSVDHRSSHSGRDRLPRPDGCDPLRERIDHTARTVGGSIILSAEDIPRRLPASGYNCPVGQSRRLSTVGLLKSFVNLASFCQNPHARIFLRGFFSYHHRRPSNLVLFSQTTRKAMIHSDFFCSLRRARSNSMIAILRCDSVRRS